MAYAKGILWKLQHGQDHGAHTASNFTINSGGASIDRIGWRFQLPNTGSDTITHIGFRYGARTGTPVAHDIGFQSDNGAGYPDGTWKGGGSPNKGSFTPPADTTWNGLWQWIALTNSYSASAGEWLVIVLEPTGTPDGSNNSSFTAHVGSHGNTPNWNGDIATSMSQTNGGAWADSGSAVVSPVIAVKSATKVYGFPYQSQYNTAISTAGNRTTAKITIPNTWCSTFALRGFRANSLMGGGGTVIAGVWNAAGTLLTGTTYTGALWHNTGNGILRTFLFDDAPVTLNAGTTYYIGYECGASGSFRFYGITLGAANDMLAMPMEGSSILSTWNGSAWSDDTTTLPSMDLILEDIAFSGGSGGGGIFGRVLV